MVNGFELMEIIFVLSECVKILKELVVVSCYFYEEFEVYDEKVVVKNFKLEVIVLFVKLLEKLIVLIDWIVEVIYDVMN